MGKRATTFRHVKHLTRYETALEIIDRAATFIEERDKGERTFGGDGRMRAATT